jgi:transposase
VGQQLATYEAAAILGLSERHTWRMLAAYRKEGAAALAHGNRGCRPPNAVAEETRQLVITLARTRYAGLNHTHITEVLAEREGVTLTRSTVRSILLSAGLASPRYRRAPRHRHRRQRMPQEGMLLQLDGSYHAWLEDRGPWLTLLLAVDDATGTVPHAVFREREDTHGYFKLLQGIIAQDGIPLGVYTDRHSVFQSPYQRLKQASAVDDSMLTQWGRALRELGVTQVFAHSPEAKGRVERANGTFQDRLVSELRLAGANTLEEADDGLSKFLPRYNERFGVPPAQAGSAYRVPDAGLDIDGVLCHKERRRVARDNTVQYHGRTLQLFPQVERTSYAGARVDVQERLDGRVLVAYRGTVLTPQEAPPLAASLRAQAYAVPKSLPPAIPASELTPARSTNGSLSALGKPHLVWYEPLISICVCTHTEPKL